MPGGDGTSTPCSPRTSSMETYHPRPQARGRHASGTARLSRGKLPPYGAVPRPSGRVERAPHVLDEVVRMLEADREPHEPFADAHQRALDRLETLVGRGRRMGDQALGVAEVVGDA